MTKAGPLRIAILAHSTNPRGGVVHALELGDALVRRGHAAVVHAPDALGVGFFRETLCDTTCISVSRAASDVATMVELRVADYLRYFESANHRRFDVFHAQDGISGNALATLKERCLIERFARTVHHVDTFDDPQLTALQARSILAADALFVVSQVWHDHLRQQFGRSSTPVGNGVDRTRFSPWPDGREDSLRRRFGIDGRPVFLAVGGVEERKNTISIFEAFAHVRAAMPQAKLLIAGGASLLDHHGYQRRFTDSLLSSGMPKGAVTIAGPISQADMPALYRIADTLILPSVKEGFGLVAIEAMACGVPVIASKIAPFTEYLAEADVAWCDPYIVTTIADAMLMTLQPSPRRRLIEHGFKVAMNHDWRNVALAHEPVYEALREPAHA